MCERVRAFKEGRAGFPKNDRSVWGLPRELERDCVRGGIPASVGEGWKAETLRGEAGYWEAGGEEEEKEAQRASKVTDDRRGREGRLDQASRGHVED